MANYHFEERAKNIEKLRKAQARAKRRHDPNYEKLRDEWVAAVEKAKLVTQCGAQVPDEHASDCTRRCRAAAQKDGRLCGGHQKALDRLNNPMLQTYYIFKQFKPARQKADGSYKATVIAKPFPSYEHAWAWSKLCGDIVWGGARPHERVCSYTVEAVRQ